MNLLKMKTKSGNVGTVVKYSVFIEIVALIVEKSTGKLIILGGCFFGNYEK